MDFILANLTLVYENKTYSDLKIKREERKEIDLNSIINGNNLKFQFSIV